jgi:hypothetical protein
MTPEQKAEIAEAPSAYRKLLARAYSGKSRSAAVKAQCLRCVGYIRSHVRNCTAYACPAHAYRPYQSDTEQEE